MSNLLIKLSLLICKVSILRTIYYNIKFLPFDKAIKFPILIGRNVVVRDSSGTISIEGNITPGMISFGVITIFKDNPSSKSYLSIRGNVTFHGHAIFRTGINFNVEKNALVEIGSDFTIGANSLIYSRSRIYIGDNCSISWDVQIIDTDFHYIQNINNGICNKNTAPIFIKDNTWIGNHVVIGKGVELQNGSIVSACSFINKKFPMGSCVIGGVPAKVLKNGYKRIYDISIEKKLTESEKCQIL